jgi:putative phage-type endonuclease
MAEEKQVLVEQRSEEWFDMRRGKITSSEISKIMGAEGKLSETAKTYLLEKVAELYGGKKTPAVGAALDWGTELEPVAVEFYEKKFNVQVNPASFVPYGDSAGGSPDGLVGTEGIIEVKCPFASANHFKHGLIKSAEDFKKAKPEYYWQCMNNMLVTNTQWCDFISFDPRVNAEYVMFVFRLERDEKEIETINTRLELATSYINELKAIFEGKEK